jgi:alkylhydroperoxidase family enzyme
MWSSHLNTSLRCGLSNEMYAPIQRGADDPYFSPFERSVMRGTDELVMEHKLSDDTWQALRAEWDEKQILDFLFTVGLYVMLAGAINSIGIERPDDLIELAEKYGAP